MEVAGKLIVFEGIDGSGKSTQAELLKRWLGSKGYRCVLTKQPGGTSLGSRLREILLTVGGTSELAELFLFQADRVQHIEEVIKPALARGEIVICDRYIESTIAYQGYGRGLDLELVRELTDLACGGIYPDLTIWLDVPMEMGLSRVMDRGKGDKFDEEGLEFRQRVQRGFSGIGCNSRRVRIEASGSLDQVAIEVAGVVGKFLGLDVVDQPY